MDCSPWEPFQGLVEFSDTEGREGDAYFVVPPRRFSSQLAGPHEWCACDDLPHLSLLGRWNLADRQALGGTLGFQSAELPSDSTLILHAYAKWGSRSPHHLAGRYSFAIWDARDQQVFACRDHLGSLPFVYYSNSSMFAFAGDMQSMLEAFRVPRVLNSEVLAATRYYGSCQIQAGETLFRGILSLPPGHHLVARRGHVALAAYWQPGIHTELVPRQEQEVYERTAELVEAAVSRWVAPGKVVALAFSGGLDSSVLAAVLSKYLRKSNRSFLALGAVNEFTGAGIPDERSFMSELSDLHNMDLRYVPATGHGPFDGIDNPSLFHTSCIRYSRRFLLDEVSSLARAQGADVLLNGSWGEFTISEAPSPYLLQSALRGRWPSLLATLRSKKQLTGISEARHLASEVKHHLFPAAPKTETHLFAPSFNRTFPTRLFPRHTIWPDTQTTQLRNVQRHLELDALMSTRSRESVFFHASPFRDPALLEFCLALPAHFKARNGIRRYLAKRSFEHMLPRSLAWRATKMPYSPDYNLRYNAQLHKAVEFINGIRKSDPVRDVVDVDRLRSLAQPAPLEVSAGYSAAVGPVPRTIYLINFLRQFPAFRA